MENKLPFVDIISKQIFFIKKKDVYKTPLYNLLFPHKKIITIIEKEISPNEFKKLDKTDLDKCYIEYMKYMNKHKKQVPSLCFRTSFFDKTTYDYPLYSMSELIILVNNFVGKNIYLEKTEEEMYDMIQKIDVSADLIKSHFEQIINSKYIGYLQYYTLYGAQIINNYLRLNQPKNMYLEKIIKKIWKMILNCKETDKDYIFYRFIHDDSFLAEFGEGTIFTDNGFLSVSRSIISDEQKIEEFGHILIKIKIPKKSHCLFLETISCFPDEHEVLFSPLSSFKIEKITYDDKFYHTKYNFNDDKYDVQQIKMKKIYIIKYLESKNIKFFNENEQKINYINFDEKSDLNNLEKQYKIKIDSKEYDLRVTYSNKSNAYRPFRFTSDEPEYSFISFYKGKLLFEFIIVDMNNDGKIVRTGLLNYNRVNLCVDEILDDKNYIDLCKKFAFKFDIKYIVIYSRYKKCIQSGGYDVILSENNFMFDEDLYNYFKYGKKRFGDNFLTYDILDLYGKMMPYKIVLKKETNGSLYLLYKKFKKEKRQNTIAEFFCWLCIKHCFMTDIFLKLADYDFYKHFDKVEHKIGLRNSHYIFSFDELDKYNIK